MGDGIEADVVTLADLFRCQDEVGLTRALMARFPADERVPAMVRFALSDGREAGGITARNPLEAAFLARIGATDGGQWYAGQVVPELFDALADDHGTPGWGVAQWLNFLRLRQIAPSNRAAVVATMRDEALGLVEWVAHYRMLGIERLFVYTNDNSDGTDALLECLGWHGLVCPIRNEVGRAPSPQRKAYAHALHFLPALRESEWVFFIDADEFFIPAAGTTLDAWLGAVDRRAEMKRPSAILFDWQWHVSGGRYDYAPDLVLRRFPHIRPHGGFKSLVRLADVVSMQPIHFPHVIPGGTIVDSDLRDVPLDGVWQMPAASGAGGWINHYWTKSFEEFAIKAARGEDRAEWARDLGLFFRWNGPETAATLAPPPAALVALVAAEHARIMALPGIARHVVAARVAMGAKLARFDGAGGLRAIHDKLNVAGAA